VSRDFFSFFISIYFLLDTFPPSSSFFLLLPPSSSFFLLLPLVGYVLYFSFFISLCISLYFACGISSLFFFIYFSLFHLLDMFFIFLYFFMYFSLFCLWDKFFIFLSLFYLFISLYFACWIRSAF